MTVKNMKYIKSFENLQSLERWGLMLSDEEFNKYASEFEQIINGFIEYADLGYDLRFETSYGTRVYMKYDDYLKKNDTYKEFINGLPAMGLFFTSTIIIPYDYEILQSVLRDTTFSIQKINDFKWKLEEFDVKGADNTIRSNIFISHKFTKDK